MGGWIGTLGALHEFKCPAKLTRSQSRERTWFTGLDSTDTVTESVGFAQRTWSINLAAATPQDTAVFEQIEAGAHGLGPFKYVDPWIAGTNLLTPGMAALSPTTMTVGAPARNMTPAQMRIDGAPVPAGMVLPAGVASFATDTPVLRSVPVTLSLMVQGTATVNLVMLRADRSHVHGNPVSVDAVNPQRVSVTFNGPAAADVVACGVWVSATQPTLVARPQITWTPGVVPWAAGQGVSGVVVDSLETDVLRARAPHFLAEAGVTLTEVRSNA